ncbi:MAG: S-layer homology domain-containing protein [Bacillota bacterium]
MERWAGEAVAKAERTGLVRGYPDHAFKPGDNATGAEP